MKDAVDKGRGAASGYNEGAPQSLTAAPHFPPLPPSHNPYNNADTEPPF